MITYSPQTKHRVRAQPLTDGTRLARLAIKLNISVAKVAHCTGATRTTVYNWYSGRGVTPAYRTRVKQLTTILRTARDSDAAWSTACSTFNLPS